MHGGLHHDRRHGSSFYNSQLDKHHAERSAISLPSVPPPPSKFLKRDSEDFAVLGGIVNLLEGFERAGLISDLPVAQLAEWMQRRVSNFCAMRAEGLGDDDGAAPLTAKHRLNCKAG